LPACSNASKRASISSSSIALTGQDDVLDAAFRRCGVLRVDTIAELFYIAEALDKQPRPKGPRLTIVTNAGGPAVLATDALLIDGGALSELSDHTIQKLNEMLPAHWSHQNPIDILGDATPERYAQGVDLAAQDPSTDGLLVILAPQAVADPAIVAERLVKRPTSNRRPILASWMGGLDVSRGEAILNRASIPTYAYPDAAARVFNLMWRYSANLAALYETPQLMNSQLSVANRIEVTNLTENIRKHGRALLTEVESKFVLAAYMIPTVPTEVASTVDQALEIAHRIGFPVVLKLHSQTITHKTDVGGVRLNLADESAVLAAFDAIRSSVRTAASEDDFLGVTVQPMVQHSGYELILGSSLDLQFGPVLLFGSGGQLVEVYRDRAVGLPPLNRTLARRLMERTKIFTALQGIRGRKPVDLDALEELIVRFSYLVSEQPWIKEIDINPLFASPDGLLALDARVVLHAPDVTDPPKCAIRPYPDQYVRPWRFGDGAEVLIRPIKPEDEPLIVRLHGRLSQRSVYLRYFHLMDLEYRTSHNRLTRICFNDYDREIALVAEHRDSDKAEREILAVGRLVKARNGDEADLALLISDEYHGRGLGTELWRRLIEVARSEDLKRVTADILAENTGMIAICRDHGFRITHTGGGTVHATLDLTER
jgi:acetyltransferase